MKPRLPRDRSGITLTEILISILIMAVGLTSLASLFPVGMERIRKGMREQRSAFVVNSAVSDLAGKNLLSPQMFTSCGWYVSGGEIFDPWIQDVPVAPATTSTINGIVYRDSLGSYRGWGMAGKANDPLAATPYYAQVFQPGEGLPVVYDPLWWAAVYASDNTVTPLSQPIVSRFGRNNDETSLVPKSGDTTISPPSGFTHSSAHGLPRLTNAYPINSQAVTSTFFSPDDVILQQEGELNAANGQGSPILPVVQANGQMLVDWAISWIFTGRRADVTNGTVYQGDVVVFHNRPFALDIDPVTGSYAPAGERVIEAVFGYGGIPQIKYTDGSVIPTTYGYSPNSRSVLLRWRTVDKLGNPVPDPEIRVGGFIADVTYEEFAARQLRFASVVTALPALANGATPAEIYPAQRCHWYRVVRKSDPEDEVPGTTSNPAAGGYRRMVVTIETPLQSKTLLGSDGNPIYANAALISPYVINVFSKQFFTR